MATAGEERTNGDALLALYRERTQHLIDEMLKARGRSGKTDARELVDAAHAAVLEEAGWELRQVLTQLRGRLELAQMRTESGGEPMTVDEISTLLQAVDRAGAILEVSLDRNETAKRMIPVETEAFDLSVELRDWLEREGMLGPDKPLSFPMEPTPVRGDPVKLPKAIGTLLQRFTEEAHEGEAVEGFLTWHGDRIAGFIGLSPSHLTPEQLMEEIASPLPVGELRFNLALVRAILERHGGALRVQRHEDAVGYGFELPALDQELV